MELELNVPVTYESVNHSISLDGKTELYMSVVQITAFKDDPSIEIECFSPFDVTNVLSWGGGTLCVSFDDGLLVLGDVKINTTRSTEISTVFVAEGYIQQVSKGIQSPQHPLENSSGGLIARFFKRLFSI